MGSLCASYAGGADMTITTDEAERLARILNRLDMDRNATALRSLAAERDALRQERDALQAERDHLEKTAMQAAQCHGRETLRADRLQAENARLQEALKKIGSCQSYHPEDVVAIARTALGETQ